MEQYINYKPIYCNFTEQDDISIESTAGICHSDPENWHAVRVATILDTDTGEVYYHVFLDRFNSETQEEECDLLAIYGEERYFHEAWHEIEAHIENKESFVMPVFDLADTLNLKAGRAQKLAREISGVTLELYSKTAADLDDLQAWYDCGGKDPQWLDDVIFSLTADIERLRQYDITAKTIRNKTGKLGSKLIEIVDIYTHSKKDKDDAKSGQADGKRAKAAQKTAESESNDGTFDDYIKAPQF